MIFAVKYGLIGLLVVLAGVPVCARADGDGDHDRARELYERGAIRGLDDILRIAAAKVPGEVVAVDLVQLGDRWVYRLQIVASDGRRVIVDVDASVGSLVLEGGDGP
jgi:uncharacterized membrane protein YkoI